MRLYQKWHLQYKHSCFNFIIKDDSKLYVYGNPWSSENGINNNLIVELQAKDSALESQITELAEDLSLEIDEKINVAFSWINV